MAPRLMHYLRDGGGTGSAAQGGTQIIFELEKLAEASSIAFEIQFHMSMAERRRFMRVCLSGYLLDRYRSYNTPMSGAAEICGTCA